VEFQSARFCFGAVATLKFKILLYFIGSNACGEGRFGIINRRG